MLVRPRSRTSGRDGATPANRGPGGAAPARLLSMPGTLRGTPSSAAPYLKQGTDLVLLQVSLDPGLLIRRHRETAAAAVQREGRRRPRRGPGQALARLGRPGVAGSARAAGVGCSPAAASAWGAESGSPGTHGAANSHNSEARGQLIHRARPHGRARRGARAGRLSSRRRQQGPERGRRAGGRPLPAGGRECAGARAPPSPRSRRHTTRLLPGLCLPCPLLPSDNAALKANGDGASFKVHINLVLVGYTLAAASAVPKGVVPTAHSEPLLAASRPTYAGSRSEKARAVRRCVGLRVCCPLENPACFAASRQVTVVWEPS